MYDVAWTRVCIQSLPTISTATVFVPKQTLLSITERHGQQEFLKSVI